MKRLLVLSIAIFFLSCSSNIKRVVVLIKGNANIDKEAKTIILKDGGGSIEKSIDFNTADKLNLTIQKPDGNETVEINGNGLFMLNTKSDTIIGSAVQYGKPKTTIDTIMQTTLLKALDSLKQLVDGKNISFAKKTYYILPYQASKITDNIDAIIVSPYHRMTSAEKVNGKDPEVYRFYSIKEIRKQIEKLKEATTYKQK